MGLVGPWILSQGSEMVKERRESSSIRGPSSLSTRLLSLVVRRKEEGSKYIA